MEIPAAAAQVTRPPPMLELTSTEVAAPPDSRQLPQTQSCTCVGRDAGHCPVFYKEPVSVTQEELKKGDP